MGKTTAIKLLHQHGFAKMPEREVGKGNVCYCRKEKPEWFCDLTLDSKRKLECLWIVGNREKDSQAFPGGRTIWDEDELKRYLQPLLK